MSIIVRVNENGDLVLTAEILEKLDSAMPLIISLQELGVYLVRSCTVSFDELSNRESLND